MVHFVITGQSFRIEVYYPCTPGKSVPVCDTVSHLYAILCIDWDGSLKGAEALLLLAFARCSKGSPHSFVQREATVGSRANGKGLKRLAVQRVGNPISHSFRTVGISFKPLYACGGPADKRVHRVHLYRCSLSHRTSDDN